MSASTASARSKSSAVSGLRIAIAAGSVKIPSAISFSLPPPRAAVPARLRRRPPVVEEAKKFAEPRQAIVAGAEASADLKHRACILARDRAPVLDAEWAATEAPLGALRDAETLHQLGKQTDAVRIVRD